MDTEVLEKQGSAEIHTLYVLSGHAGLHVVLANFNRNITWARSFNQFLQACPSRKCRPAMYAVCDGIGCVRAAVLSVGYSAPLTTTGCPAAKKSDRNVFVCEKEVFRAKSMRPFYTYIQISGFLYRWGLCFCRCKAFETPPPKFRCLSAATPYGRPSCAQRHGQNPRP